MKKKKKASGVKPGLGKSEGVRVLTWELHNPMTGRVVDLNVGLYGGKIYAPMGLVGEGLKWSLVVALDGASSFRFGGQTLVDLDWVRKNLQPDDPTSGIVPLIEEWVAKTLEAESAAEGPRQ